MLQHELLDVSPVISSDHLNSLSSLLCIGFGISLGTSLRINLGISLGINLGIIILLLLAASYLSCLKSPLSFLQTTSTPRVPFFESDLGSAWV